MSSNLKVNTILPSTGTTIGIGTVGGLINVVGNIDVNSTSGISTFNGLEISGIVTAKAGAAVTYYGDGSNLTSLPSQLTLSNNADNRVITGGSGTNLVGESTLTYNGSGTLEISDSGSSYTLRGAGVVKHGIDASSSDNDLVIQNNKTAQNVTSNIIFKGSGSGGASVSEKLRITSTGEMGVNTTAPVEKLGISGNMRFVNPNGNTSRITALPSGTYNTGTSGGSAICFQRIADGGGGSDEIFFETHWQGNRHGESCRINKYGNLAFPSGNGIDFSATSNSSGSMTSELLDDYEEGSFTPTLPNGTSLTNSGSYYTKIGRFVSFYCHISSLNIPNNSNQFRVAGLPFNVLSGSYGGPCSISYAGAANDSRIANLAPNTQSGSNYIYFHAVGIGQGYILTNAHFQVMNGGNLNIQGCYMTAS